MVAKENECCIVDAGSEVYTFTYTPSRGDREKLVCSILIRHRYKHDFIE